MPTIGYRLLVAALALMLLAAADAPPSALSRGISVTHWFRFPPDRDPAALRGYLGDATLAQLAVDAMADKLAKPRSGSDPAQLRSGGWR